MTRRHKRLAFVAVAVLGAGTAAVLVLDALRSNVAYFFSPSQVAAGEAPAGSVFRVGGLVETGSVVRPRDDLTIEFVVTDTAREIRVRYTGVLPDLFGEGQGVVARGRLGDDGVFRAEEVLAKHDEAYMPPEVSEALEMAAKGGSVVASPHAE